MTTVTVILTPSPPLIHNYPNYNNSNAIIPNNPCYFNEHNFNKPNNPNHNTHKPNNHLYNRILGGAGFLQGGFGRIEFMSHMAIIP